MLTLQQKKDQFKDELPIIFINDGAAIKRDKLQKRFDDIHDHLKSLWNTAYLVFDNKKKNDYVFCKPIEEMAEQKK